MLPISQALIDELKANTRQFTLQVDVYFDGEASAPVTFTQDDVVQSVSILKEIAADASSYLGTVSANELRIALNNQDNEFSPANREGTYYTKLKKGVTVCVYISIFHIDAYTRIPVGKFTVAEWLGTDGQSARGWFHIRA